MTVNRYSWLGSPAFMIVFAVLALVVGMYMSRGASRVAAERSSQPLRVSCVQFPGACDEQLSARVPEGFEHLHAEAAQNDSVWHLLFEQERRSGVFPDKAITDLSESIAYTEGAVADARALVNEAEVSGDSVKVELTRGILAESYQNQIHLLERSIRLLREAL